MNWGDLFTLGVLEVAGLALLWLLERPVRRRRAAELPGPLPGRRETGRSLTPRRGLIQGGRPSATAVALPTSPASAAARRSRAR